MLFCQDFNKNEFDLNFPGVPIPQKKKYILKQNNIYFHDCFWSGRLLSFMPSATRCLESMNVRYFSVCKARAHFNATARCLAHLEIKTQDEREGLVGALRNEAKAAGIPDTPEAGLEFLISRIKSNLHIALCFSPVGDIFRIRKNLPGFWGESRYRAILPFSSRYRAIRPLCLSGGVLATSMSIDEGRWT